MYLNKSKASILSMDVYYLHGLRVDGDWGPGKKVK